MGGIVQSPVRPPSLQDPDRPRKMRIAIEYMLKVPPRRRVRGWQSRMAEWFGVSRQRIAHLIDDIEAEARAQR